MSAATAAPAWRVPTAAEQADKARLKEAWESDRVRLLVDQPFLAMLAMQLELVPVVDVRVPTACTDGRTVYGNPEFLLGLPAADRAFVLAHEVFHCALGHGLRRLGREPGRWNIAVDHEVNNLLRAQGMELPSGAVWFSRLAGANAETVYQAVEGGGRDPLDDHLDADAPLPHPGSGVLDADFAPELARGALEDWPARVAAATQRCAALGVQLPEEILSLAQQIGQPRVPWQEVLRRFVTQAIGGQRSWSPPSRRHVHAGMYLPCTRQPRLRAVLAVDTSGSVHAILPEFAAELFALLASFGRYEVMVLWADDRVQRIAAFSDEDPPDPAALQVPLGGGTDFRPAFREVQAHQAAPDVFVYLTDGEGPAPDRAPPWPVLWALPARHHPPAPWGEAVHVEAWGGS